MWGGLYDDIVGFDQKPSFSKVEIEEVGGDLTAGVRLLPMERVRSTSEPTLNISTDTFYASVDEENFDEDHYEFILTLETLAQVADNDSAAVWALFNSNDIQSCEPMEAYYGIKTKKYEKCVQQFFIKFSEKPSIPYIQFYCKSKKVKYLDSYFREGDIMTTIIKHPDYPVKWPNPAVITVKPTATQTYVPMVGKQKLIVVCEEDESLEFKAHPNGNILFAGDKEATFGHRCRFFDCKKTTVWSEPISIKKSKKKDFKTIIIPNTEKDTRWPIILNPQKDSILYAHNCDGFLIRFWKGNDLPVCALNCPARILYTVENAQYVERKVEITRPRPYFHFQKKENNWMIR